MLEGCVTGRVVRVGLEASKTHMIPSYHCLLPVHGSGCKLSGIAPVPCLLATMFPVIMVTEVNSPQL